jgi:hypothetical protein
MPKAKAKGSAIAPIITWADAKAQIVLLLRQFGTKKIKLPFFGWTIKFSVLADQIEKYAP